MAEVLFYHLTRAPLEAALPQLLEATLARGWRAELRGREPGLLDWLDVKLWTYRDDAFLPHGRAGVGGDAARDRDQPVLLTTGATGVDAEVLFLVDQAEVDLSEAARVTRVCILFDGNDPAALDTARQQWKAVADAGIKAVYWSQESGAWQKKVEANA